VQKAALYPIGSAYYDWGPMKRFALPLLALLLLAGCASSEPTTAAPTATSIPEATATPTPIATPSPTPTAEQADAAPAPADVTSQVRDASPSLESYVKTATSPEAGRITVETSLIDPRGEAGSPEAVLALQLCSDVVANMSGVSYVSIMEDDGSSWVLYGHPSYGNTCTEV
jgi:type IV pilus biogenesis protein CpaD/CtpE